MPGKPQYCQRRPPSFLLNLFVGIIFADPTFHLRILSNSTIKPLPPVPTKSLLTNEEHLAGSHPESPPSLGGMYHPDPLEDDKEARDISFFTAPDPTKLAMLNLRAINRMQNEMANLRQQLQECQRELHRLGEKQDL
ncbi:hypothetical protein K438DRAFT_1874078 [Mycena galopus ATCC 62051]|nr:hypothetical protein K438DRAFT_1874078 [Mycena galopus ATCC 62051]